MSRPDLGLLAWPSPGSISRSQRTLKETRKGESVMERFYNCKRKFLPDKKKDAAVPAEDCTNAVFWGAKADSLEKLFERQVRTLIENGYPSALGVNKDQFLNYVNPLREKIPPNDEVKDGN